MTTLTLVDGVVKRLSRLEKKYWKGLRSRVIDIVGW